MASDWSAEQSVEVLRDMLTREVRKREAAEQARDDFTTSTYEMLGELLEAHQIAPDPCPGGPCVANALLAIGHALTAAEAERDELKRLVEGSSRHQGDLLRAYEQERQRATRLAAVEAERDRERDGWVRCTEMRLAAEQRATRLEALEAAGRHWRAAGAGLRVYEGELVPWKQAGWQAAMEALAAAEAALEAALAGLDAPPGEGA